jgi:hypothetical protein
MNVRHMKSNLETYDPTIVGCNPNIVPKKLD